MLSKICEFCDEKYSARVQYQRFCSEKCRSRWHSKEVRTHRDFRHRLNEIERLVKDHHKILNDLPLEKLMLL